MNSWRNDIAEEAVETRADVIIQKKKQRRQDPQAKGLGAVAIARRGTRTVHQRNEDRHFLEGTVAKAAIGGAEHQVKLLNVSSNGVMIGFDGGLQIGDTIRLGIDECAPITTAVRWVRGERVGLEFIAETVIIAEAGVQDFIIKTIAREHAHAGYARTSQVGAENRGAEKRHPLVWIAKLCWDKREATVRMRNISRTGAMVEIAQKNGLLPGAEVTMSLHNSGDIPATVRWIAGQQYGLEFRVDFDVALLVNENFAELAPPDDAAGLGTPGRQERLVDEDFDTVRVRFGNVEIPHHPPEMDYKRLTLDELYATLYAEGPPQ